MVLRAAVIGGKSKSTKWTVEALRNYFDEVDHIVIEFVDINFSGKKAEIIYQGKPLGSYDCVLVKGSFRYAQLQRAVSDLLSLNNNVYLPIKPQAFTIAHDKLLTQLVLQKHNIPMPKTYLTATVDAARDLLEKLNYPIIMKFPQGTQGKGVMFADSFASASSILDALNALNQPFIIQEYVESGSTDIRLLVVGNRVVAAMKRKGRPNEKRANIHAGGVGEAFVPDELMKKIAVSAARAIDAEVCGVDIIESPRGPLVIEVNISPGLQGISNATGVDVADEIAKYLFEQTKARVSKEKEEAAKKIISELSNDKVKEVITQLDFRGTRILLPELVTKISGFSEHDDVQLKISKDKLLIKKFF